MCAIYNADIYCDDCADLIRAACKAAGTVPDDPDDEGSYDSDEYPKYADCSAEADCPWHCGDCGVFLENDLTADGAEYVREAVNEALRTGNDDCVAITEWMDYYSWIDYDDPDDDDEWDD